MITSIPTLHRASLKFNQSGHVIFALRYHVNPEDQIDSNFPGLLTTIDAKDYSTIGVFSKRRCVFEFTRLFYVSFSAGFDLKRKFEALALDSLDNNVVLAEPYNETTGTLGRLFRIGIDKGVPELEEEMEEEEYGDTDDEEDGDGFEEYDGWLQKHLYSIQCSIENIWL